MSLPFPRGSYSYPSIGAFNEAWCVSDSTLNQIRIALSQGALSNIEWLFKTPSEYISSVRFYPLDLEGLFANGELDRQIKLANVDLQYTEGGATYSCVGLPIVERSDKRPRFNIGNFKIERTFNNFLDFSPYTMAYINVPYFGEVELPLAQILGHICNVYLDVDFGSGRARFEIYDTTDDGKLVLVSNETQLGFEIPFGFTNGNEIAKTLLTTALSVGGSAMSLATGNPFGVAEGIKTATTASVGLVNGLQGHYTNAQTGGGGIWSVNQRAPYIRIVYPNPVNIEDYGKYNGYMLNETRTLGNLSGYTIVSDVHLEGIATDQDATDYANENELAEIESLLKSGVIL